MFLFEVYDTIEHPALGQTPREAYFAGVERAGIRTNRSIAYDQVFFMATLPTTLRGSATVSPGRGVIINHVYYWAEAFRNPTIENHAVSVRYDPFNIGVAYAFVNNRWVECYSEHYAVLQNHSEKEMMLASKEIHRRRQLHARERFKMTARKLADFLESAESEEKCLIQRLRDRESKSIPHNRSVLSATPEPRSLPDDRIESSPPVPSVLGPLEATAVYGDF
jgi:hypothetical protein